MSTALFSVFAEWEWYGYVRVCEALRNRGWRTVGMLTGIEFQEQYRLGGNDRAVGIPGLRASPRMKAVCPETTVFSEDHNFNAILEECKPDVVVLSTDRGCTWREMADIAKRRGIKVAIVDCGWGHTNAYTQKALGGQYPFIGDAHCVMSEPCAEVIRKGYGRDGYLRPGYEDHLSKLRVTGSPIPDAPCVSVDGLPWQPDKEKGPIILIDQHDFPADLDKRVWLFKTAIRLAQCFPDRQVFIRPHFEKSWWPERRWEMDAMFEDMIRYGVVSLPPNLAMSKRGVCHYDAFRAAWRIVTMTSLCAVDAGLVGTPAVAMKWFQYHRTNPEAGWQAFGSHPGEEESFWHWSVPFYTDGSVATAETFAQLVEMLPTASISQKLREEHCNLRGGNAAENIADVLCGLE